MNEASRKNARVLLISPLTFSYHVAICEALQQIGYEPTWWNDKASASTAYKIALRLFPRLTRRWTQAHFLRLADALAPDSVDHILVIKGEGLDARTIAHLRSRQPRATLGLYLWDSVDNVKGAGSIAPLFDAISTFDPVDARENGWHYRPLFARHVALSAPEQANKDFDWCFIGTIHSDRHKVITRLRRAGGPQRSFVFAYFQSPFVLRVRKLFDWTLRSAPASTLSTTPMPAAEVAAVIARSRAVLDVEHPRQRGLTMRTIETLLTGKKLLTTNRHLVDCDLYDASRAQMIDRHAPTLSQAFLDAPVRPVTPELRARYTCESWIAELLDKQIAAHSKTTTRVAA
jgi:hypothetical protein